MRSSRKGIGLTIWLSVIAIPAGSMGASPSSVRPLHDDGSCPLPLSRAIEAAERKLGAGFKDYPATHIVASCFSGKWTVAFRSRAIPAKDLLQVKDGIAGSASVNGKTGKVESTSPGCC